MISANDQLRFLKTSEHIDALIVIYRKSPEFSSRLEQLLGLKCVIDAATPFYASLVSPPGGRSNEAVEQTIQLTDRLIAAGNHGVPPEDVEFAERLRNFCAEGMRRGRPAALNE
jgi:hypothetical protein